MAVYGVDEYGKSLYGTDLDVDYTVTGLSAVQSDYGRITLSWSSPPLSDWTGLTLVRSGYGYPVAVTDGVTLASWPVTGTFTTYDDVGLESGYWYYTLFLAAPFTAWSAAGTYVAGDRVGFGGSVWYCVAPITTNVTPGTNSAVWIATNETTLYRPAGSVACLSVRDYGYANLLDSLVPAPYKATPSASTDSGSVNSELSAFLSVLGFGFAQVNTELDDLLEVYDVTTTRQDRLYEIGQTLGLSSETGSSARLQRLRTLQAAALNQQRGTQNGVIGLVRAAAGLSASVATGANLMLSQDQSAFYEPPAMAWNPAEPYQLGDQVVYLGSRYSVTGFNLSISPSTYLAQGVTGSPNTLSGGGSILEASATGPTTMSIPFTVLAPGSYFATIASNFGSAMGVLSATLDGVPVQIGLQILRLGRIHVSVNFVASLDLYSASTSSATVVTFATALAAGAHTLVLTCTSKNASSSGFNIAATGITMAGSPVVYPPGNPPTGATGSAAQWTATAASTDTTTYANAATGGMGTWSALTNTSLATGYLGA